MDEKLNTPIKVCKVSELLPGQSKCLKLNGKEIAVFNLKGKFYAIDNACLHAGGSLSDGYLDEENCQVTCSWHGWIFDLASGKCVTHPRQDVFTNSYNVKVSGDEILLQI